MGECATKIAFENTKMICLFQVVVFLIFLNGYVQGLQDDLKGHVDVSLQHCPFSKSVPLYDGSDQKLENQIGVVPTDAAVTVSPTTEIDGYYLVDGNDLSGRRRIGYAQKECIQLDQGVSVKTVAPENAPGSPDTDGYIDGSQKCETGDAVYVYDSPKRGTQKRLGYLQDGTHVNVRLIPHVPGYYFIDGDDGDNRLRGYVRKECIALGSPPSRKIVMENDPPVPPTPPPSPTLHSGMIEVFPLNLGDTFEVEIGNNTRVCTANSTKELDCQGPLPKFQAVIASQNTDMNLCLAASGMDTRAV